MSPLLCGTWQARISQWELCAEYYCKSIIGCIYQTPRTLSSIQDITRHVHSSSYLPLHHCKALAWISKMRGTARLFVTVLLSKIPRQSSCIFHHQIIRVWSNYWKIKILWSSPGLDKWHYRTDSPAPWRPSLPCLAGCLFLIKTP